MQIFQTLEEEGEKTPLDDKPVLFFDLEHIWSLFWSLNRSRQDTGFGSASLQLSEIVTWLDFIGITDEAERLEAVRYIQEMDAKFLEWSDMQRKRQQGSK